MIQQVTFPGLNLGIIQQPTPIRNIQRPGSSLDVTDLMITFVVDEDLFAWTQIFDWIKWMKNTKVIDNKVLFHDATLSLLTNKLNAQLFVKFIDIFPYSLGEISYTTTDTSAEVLTSTVSFKVNDYDIHRKIPT